MASRTRQRFAAALLSLVVAPLAGVVLGPPSTAAGSGSISGVVTSTTGKPLWDVHVAALRWDGDDFRQFGRTYTRTARDGSYSLRDLPPGAYILSVDDTRRGEYLRTDWPVQATPDTAIAIENDTVATGIDVQLAKGGRITGTITGPDAAGVIGPAGSVGVEVLMRDEVYGEWIHLKGTRSNHRGKFVLTGLETGEYTLSFSDHSEGRYLEEFWQDADDIEHATSFVVTQGTTTSDRDVLLSRAGHISGTVTDQLGGRIDAVVVYAVQWSEAHDEWRQVGGTYAKPNGDYDLGGLPTGTYRVRFELDVNQDNQVWFPDAATVEGGADVAVVAGATTPDVDARLTVPEGPPPVVNSVRPEITGTPRAGETLVLDTGAWLPATSTLAVQWYAGDEPLAGRTATTLAISNRLARQLSGKRLSVLVSASATGYETTVVRIKVPGRVRG